MLDLTSLESAIASLRRSLDETLRVMPTVSPVLQETLRAGVIQHFEVAYEQCRKAMKRWLENNVSPEDVDRASRRGLFRLAAEKRLIDSVDLWMTFHEGRNKTSHTYDLATAKEVFERAVAFAAESEKFLATLSRHND